MIPSQDKLTAYVWTKEFSRTSPSGGDLIDPLYALERVDGIPFGFTTNATKTPSASASASASASFQATNQSSILGIDQIHRLGYLHFGAWIFVMDNQQRLLLTKRTPTMVTCPSTWSLLGEHTAVGEEYHPERTVLRGLQEEFGLEPPRNYVKRLSNLLQDSGSAVYYYREYGHGPALGDRVDRQLTYLWYVELNVPGETILQKITHPNKTAENIETIKEESVGFTLRSVPELELWLKTRPGDFCHDSILSLFRLGLKHLKLLLLSIDHNKEEVDSLQRLTVN